MVKSSVRILKFVLLSWFLPVCMFPSLVWSQTLIEQRFRLDTEAEVLLNVIAAAPNTSWESKDNEAAVLTIFTDGQYHQDIILFAGAQTFTYRVALGRVAPGNHAVRVEFNRKQSAPKVSGAKIEAVGISIIDRTKDEYKAIAHSPILYARPNTIGRFSDIPLLMWYEQKRAAGVTTIIYSMIFSNEDGGTGAIPSALMARWGRMTDIEWVYEVKLNAEGQPLESTFQSVNHGTQPFRGKKEADHPLLLVASDNNNFSDGGTSEMRFALRPIAFELSRNSREEVMDRHPWIYQIMVEELQREGKIAPDSHVGPQIADPRQYLFVEAAVEQHGTVVSFAVKLKGSRKWYSSDLGINAFKIERSGYFRTAIRLPPQTALDQIERIAIRCDFQGDIRSRDAIGRLPSAECVLKSVNKIFLLGDNYQPGPSLTVNVQPLKLRSGDMVELHLDHL